MSASRPRPYHEHGQGVVKKALPFLIARVVDPAVPEADLSPVERAVRTLRQEMITDLGSDLSAAQRVLLEAVLGSVIALQSVDAYMFGQAEKTGLVGGRTRRVLPLVQQRMRVADALARQLQILGLKRRAPKVKTLQDYLAEKYSGTDGHAEAANDQPAQRPKRTPV
jgi:hypothetical protein